MTARCAFAFAVALATVATGCGTKSPRYYITAQHQEAVPDEVDGQWFTREVWLRNELAGIELVYCPILPNTQNGEVTVCRTAIVWEPGHSRLTDPPSESDQNADGAKQEPATAPTPEPPPVAPPAEAASPPRPPAPVK